MNIREELISLGKDLEEERNEAFSLWTWLPSYQVAKKYHGDYADEYMPSIADVMKESCLYFASLKYPDSLTEDDKLWFTECPCGEYCEQNEKKQDVPEDGTTERAGKNA